MIGIARSNNYTIPYKAEKPLTRVELHVHLDGAVRHETIYELAKAKNQKLPGDGSFQALQHYLIVKHGVSLADFLSRFDVVLPAIKGDLRACERIAYEMVEDSAKSGIVHFEARYCPHLLLPDEVTDSSELKDWVWKVSEALIKGLKHGEKEFGAKGYLILTCIRGFPKHTFTESLELSLDKNFHEGRILGIDIAGNCENAGEEGLAAEPGIKLCSDAKKFKIPITIHAGESGDANEVVRALDVLYADRIGHGYRIIHDDKVYNRIRNDKVHLECCPWSSLLTAAISPGMLPHPVVDFFRDDFNVSISTDDPTLTGTTLDHEFRLLSKWGLNEAHFAKATFNAARSSFLPENEKQDLIQDLSKKFGITL